MNKSDVVCWISMLWLSAAELLSTDVCADELRERLKDVNGVRTEVWVYNDIPAAIQEARRTGKPLFVTFRCVPCRDCAAFDADVANGNEQVRELAAKEFIAVRQVEMKGVDLTQFQFDYDLNRGSNVLCCSGECVRRIFYGSDRGVVSDGFSG